MTTITDQLISIMFDVLETIGTYEDEIKRLQGCPTEGRERIENLELNINTNIDTLKMMYGAYLLLGGNLSKGFKDLMDNIDRYKR